MFACYALLKDSGIESGSGSELHRWLSLLACIENKFQDITSETVDISNQGVLCLLASRL